MIHVENQDSKSEIPARNQIVTIYNVYGTQLKRFYTDESGTISFDPRQLDKYSKSFTLKIGTYDKFYDVPCPKDDNPLSITITKPIKKGFTNIFGQIIDTLGNPVGGVGILLLKSHLPAHTSKPSSTDTSKPSSTDTSKPSSTDTSKPSSTDAHIHLQSSMPVAATMSDNNGVYNLRIPLPIETKKYMLNLSVNKEPIQLDFSKISDDNYHGPYTFVVKKTPKHGSKFVAGQISLGSEEEILEIHKRAPQLFSNSTSISQRDSCNVSIQNNPPSRVFYIQKFAMFSTGIDLTPIAPILIKKDIPPSSPPSKIEVTKRQIVAKNKKRGRIR